MIIEGCTAQGLPACATLAGYLGRHPDPRHDCKDPHAGVFNKSNASRSISKTHLIQSSVLTAMVAAFARTASWMTCIQSCIRDRAFITSWVEGWFLPSIAVLKVGRWAAGGVRGVERLLRGNGGSVSGSCSNTRVARGRRATTSSSAGHRCWCGANKQTLSGADAFVRLGLPGAPGNQDHGVCATWGAQPGDQAARCQGGGECWHGGGARWHHRELCDVRGRSCDRTY